MKQFKSNNGITLIALIITIIILLILAMVTINILINQGIIGHAQNAVETYDEKQVKEDIALSYDEYKMQKFGANAKSLYDFFKDKYGADHVTDNGDGSITVTVTSNGKTYTVKLKEDGNLEILNGISLDPTKLVIEYDKQKIVTEKVTATLIGIEGDISWSTEDAKVARIYSIEDNSATIRVVGKGTTSIVATCGKYKAVCKVLVRDPLVLGEGSFIQYSVSYKDVMRNYDYSTTNGWRLIEYTDNGDGTYSNVKLMSTGIPARVNYYYNDQTNNEWFETDEEKLSQFRHILGDDDFEFYTGNQTYYALQAAAGLYYNFSDIKFAYGEKNRGYNLGVLTSITNGSITYDNSNTTETTASNLFLTDGANQVRVLTLPEVNRLLERTDIDSTASVSSAEKEGIYYLANLQKVEGMSEYKYENSHWWIASPAPNEAYNQHLLSELGYGSFQPTTGASYFNYSNAGVRPVIIFSGNVTLIPSDEGNYFEIKK